MMVTVDVVDGQVPLLILHCKIVVPVPIPDIPVVAKLGVVILEVPDSTVHKPVPITGKFAPKVAVVVQIV